MTMVQLKNKQLSLPVECPEVPRFLLLAPRITKWAVLALKSQAGIAHTQQPGRAGGPGRHVGVASLTEL